jgi:hypothetical protein
VTAAGPHHLDEGALAAAALPGGAAALDAATARHVAACADCGAVVREYQTLYALTRPELPDADAPARAPAPPGARRPLTTPSGRVALLTLLALLAVLAALVSRLLTRG